MISLKKRRFVFDRRAPAIIFRTRKIVNTFSFQCSPFILPRFQEVEIGGNLLTWPESFLFLLSSYPWVVREIVKPAACFLRGISTGNVKLEDEGRRKHTKRKKGTSSSLPERGRERFFPLEDRTSSVWYPFVNSPKGSWLCAACDSDI